MYYYAGRGVPQSHYRPPLASSVAYVSFADRRRLHELQLQQQPQYVVGPNAGWGGATWAEPPQPPLIVETQPVVDVDRRAHHRKQRVALTYSQCEILSDATVPGRLSTQPKSGATVLERLPTRPKSPEIRRNLPMTLEEIKAQNEQNLKLTANSHVQDIYKQLETSPMPQGAEQSERVRITDIEKAKAILKQLNPDVKDPEALLKVLLDHVSGKPVDLKPEMFNLENAQQLFLPTEAPAGTDPAALAPSHEGGFKASHSFVMRQSNGQEQEFVVAKVIESPEVLAVSDLLGPIECQDLITLAGSVYVPARISVMRIRCDEDTLTFAIPDDLSDMEFPVPSVVSTAKTNTVACLHLDSYRETNIYPFLRSVTARAAAVCRCSPDKIPNILIERYEPGQFAKQLHNSNKRMGTVIIGLTPKVHAGTGGALAFPAAQLEITAKQGMAVWIPACYPDTLPQSSAGDEQVMMVPDIRTEYGITEVNSATVSEPLYYAVMHVLP